MRDGYALGWPDILDSLDKFSDFCMCQNDLRPEVSDHL